MRLGKTADTVVQVLLWTVRDFVREPESLFWTVAFPILMTLTLGQITASPHRLKASAAVLAPPGAAADRARAWLTRAPGQGAVRWSVLAPGEFPKALALGRVQLGVERPWDPARRRWRFDPADARAELAYRELREDLAGLPPDADPVTVPGGRYIDFLLPGLLALGVVNACLWGVGWRLVELREKRLLRLMLATPLDREAFFAALFLGRLLLSLAEMAVLLVFSRLLFHVRVLGDPLALAVLWLAGSAAFFGLAVLVGSRTDRPSVGQGLINAVTLPVFLISGVFFSLDNFPPALAAAFRWFPPTLLVDGTRAVMSGGAGWSAVAGPTAALLAMGAGCYALGRALFRFY